MYLSASCQLINFDKSEISFSQNVPMIAKTCYNVGWKLWLLSVIQSIWGRLLLLVGLSNIFSNVSKIGCGNSWKIGKKNFYQLYEEIFLYQTTLQYGSRIRYLCDELFSPYEEFMWIYWRYPSCLYILILMYNNFSVNDVSLKKCQWCSSI